MKSPKSLNLRKKYTVDLMSEVESCAQPKVIYDIFGNSLL